MATIREVDIGTVTSVNVRYVRRHSVKELAGVVGSYPQDMKSERTIYDVKGFLDNPTQAERESVTALRDGNPSLVALTEEGLYGWGKVIDNDFRLSEYRAGIWNYRMLIHMIPCIGTMKMLHDDGRFSDVDYMCSVKSLDPFASKCGVTHASSVTHQHSFYVLNSDLSDTNTLEFEVMCGDDIIQVELWAWKSSEWSEVGTWVSGGTEFGATAAWTDEDSDEHTFRVNHDVRGANVANFTKNVSNTLGTERRVMVQISAMVKLPTYGLSTDYGEYQLLMKLKLTHTEREASRTYPIITYKDGGFSLGPT